MYYNGLVWNPLSLRLVLVLGSTSANLFILNLPSFISIGISTHLDLIALDIPIIALVIRTAVRLDPYEVFICFIKAYFC